MGKAEGRVIDIVERQTNRFVGTYFEEGGLGLVQVDGRVFTNPIYVGDPGAKGARPDDKVVLDMVRFPSHVRDGEGVLVDILGQRGDPGIDTLSRDPRIRSAWRVSRGCDGRCSNAGGGVQRHRRRHSNDPDAPSGDLSNVPGAEGRRDLTGETIVTIDPVDARDFDDAISLRRLENGHWLLGVHIADVSHFVRPKSPLDREARNRATSVYLPDQVIPMLPEIISNNLASLQPDKVRFAMTAEIEFTKAGVRVAAETFKSAIKSCRRFAYEEIDEFLADPPAWKKQLSKEVHGLVGRMHKLAMILRQRRFRRGSLELSLPEVKIDLDADGRVAGAHVEEQTESHQIIEEFMLAANEAVAEMLADEGLMFLRRVHAAPDPRKLTALGEFVRDLGFKTESLESRFALQKILTDVRGDPRERAVHFAALRSMQRATYSPEEEGHYALASDCYCHFTSPIRRYPDLTIHRLLDAVNRGEPIQQNADALFAEGDHCSEREQRATEAERELVKVKLLNFLSDKLGMQLDGIVTGVESFGLYVAGSELPAEGLVHISALADDHYQYDRRAHTLSGFRSGNTYRLGDAVRVEVAAVDVERRVLDFRIVRHGTRPDSKTPGRSSKKKPHEKQGHRRAKHQHSRKPGKGRGRRKK